MSQDERLRQLAARAGISPEWTDQAGKRHAVSPESLRAILAAFGLPADNAGALNAALERLDAESDPAEAAAFTTTRIGQPVPLPACGPAGRRLEVILESGERRVVTTLTGPDGVAALPPFETPGYHTVHLPEGEVTVAAAPTRCVTFSDRNGGRAGFGLAAQIYSLRSPHDGSIGHFGGVAALGRDAGKLGADALAISPVHALYGASAAQFSPYSPSTRLFYNPLHADPEVIFPADLLAATIAEEGLGEAMDKLSREPLIDWHLATPLRQRLLHALFRKLQDNEALSGQRAAFEQARAEASPLLRSHAVFEVLHAAEFARDPSAWHWRNWTAAHRDPDSAEVAAFAADNAAAVDYQIFLQWLTGLSYSQAQQACRQSGMTVGLIADLAIGMDSSGSHAWSRQQEVLNGVSVGAPPDYYSADGQSWGLTTFSPRGLAASGYAPFIDTLRASLRHVGGIRIDHVMGMSRLWLVPEGASAVEGAYVAFPAETLFRLIALESWRHQAIVIGEDLGILPYGFRDYLRDQGVAGLRVLRFERGENSYIPPAEWDPAAAALTTTHDLVPTAGWWAGSDLDEGPERPAQDDQRAWDRGLLWGSFEREGLVDGNRPAPEETDPVVDAAIRFVAKSPCTLKLLAIEDALGIRTQPNVPGTTIEKPNWRHRLDGKTGTLLDDAKVRERLAHLGPARSET